MLYVSDPDTFSVTVNNAYQDILLEIQSFSNQISAPKIICSSFSTVPEQIWAGEPFTIRYQLTNIGKKEHTWTVHSKMDDIVIEETEVYLNAGESNNYVHKLNSTNPCTYNFTVEGLNSTFNQEIIIRFPGNVLTRSSYYYSFAEKYVAEYYGIPEDTSVDSLFSLLNQVKLPPYDMNYFDCTDSSTFIEWVLEGAGFTAYLQENDEHQWVQVDTMDGLVVVEATSLCHGEDYAPPGIVDNMDGAFTEFTSEYLRFIQWKIDYPPSEYQVDPNITFEEWIDEYLIEVYSPGIQTPSGYYRTTGRELSPVEMYEGETVNEVRTYKPLDELDWWNTEPFSQQYPFKYW